MSEGNRSSNFKHNGKTAEVLRRRRADETVSLRKVRKNEILMKRRDIQLNTHDLSVSKEDSVPVDANMIEMFFQGWGSGFPNQEYSPARMTRHILKSTHYDHQVISKLVTCLPLLSNLSGILLMNDGDDDLCVAEKVDAAKIFDSIILERSEYIENIERVGAIESLLSSLKSTHVPVVKYCVLALGNYMGDNAARQISAIQKGVITHFVHLLKLFRTEESVMSVLSWALVNVCRDPDTKEDYSSPIYESLTAISYLINTENEEIIQNSLGALEFLTGEKYYQCGVNRVIQSAISARLVQLLGHQTQAVAALALKVVGNILLSGEDEAQVLITLGVIPYLIRLLGCKEDKIIQESLWSLANICAGTPEQINAVIQAGAIPEVVTAVKAQLSVATRKEGAWILTHIARSENQEIIQYLFDQKVLQALSYLLTTVGEDPGTVLVTLKGLRRMLHRAAQAGDDKLDLFRQTIENFGGLRFIEKYVHHENDDIDEYANLILELYFYKDTETETETDEE